MVGVLDLLLFVSLKRDRNCQPLFFLIFSVSFEYLERPLQNYVCAGSDYGLRFIPARRKGYFTSFQLKSNGDFHIRERFGCYLAHQWNRTQDQILHRNVCLSYRNVSCFHIFLLTGNIFEARLRKACISHGRPKRLDAPIFAQLFQPN